jgi:VanZ family protein
MAGPLRDRSHATGALASLCLLYALLIAYASLYPFEGWRNQGLQPWVFVAAPLPRYWTWFDVVSNALGYLPLGILLALGLLGAFPRRTWLPLVSAVVLGAALSFVLEGLQGFLPTRRPSNIDFVLNSLGTAAGAVTGWGMHRLGLLDALERARTAWLLPHAGPGLVLLAIWPLSLLFPTPVPFGLGHVLDRLQDTLAELLDDTAFAGFVVPSDPVFEPLGGRLEFIGVTTSVFAVCMLAFAVTRRGWHRLLVALMVLSVGIGVSALSSAITWGPTHALAWLTPATERGLWWAGGLALLLAWLPGRLAATLGLMAFAAALIVVNQAPEDPYYADALKIWEQGRFIQFHGLTRWIGWLWPFAAVAVMLRSAAARS